ncbi:MAG: hypothetical protein LC754_19110 [Acidobacteria bacterium]|nr:hypothetical protein [Acidobacteriota bacterium]
MSAAKERAKLTPASAPRDGLVFDAQHEPDGDGGVECEARVLLMILGLPADEIERVVSELNLDSQLEM